MDLAQSLLVLFEADRRRIQGIGRLAGSCLRVHHYLQGKALCRTTDVTAATGINRTSVAHCLAALTELGIVRELTGRQRRRVFAYDQYLKALAEGTEPLCRETV